MLYAALRDWLEDDCIISRPTISDDFEQTVVYTPLETVKCNIRTLTGDEALELGAIDTRATHRVVIDFTDVTEGDRLTVRGEILNVRYVDRKKLMEDDFLQIDAEYIGVVQ